MSTNRRKKLRAIIERLIPERNEHCIYFENGRQHSGFVGSFFWRWHEIILYNTHQQQNFHPNSQTETNKNIHTLTYKIVLENVIFIYIKCIFRI